MDAERIAEILGEHVDNGYGACWKCSTMAVKYGHPCETFELASLAAEAERYRAALEELKATVQSVCEAGHVDFPGLEILGEALGESDEPLAAAALETGVQG